MLPCQLYSQLNADFTANKTQACENSIIQFQDLSTIGTGAINSWVWTVDGTPFSTQTNPVYYFSVAGDYEICLTIRDNGGNTHTTCKTNYVVIHNPPNANFSSDQQVICEAPGTVNFTDLSIPADTNIVRWIWDFGDGIVDSSMQSPTHTYTISGNFDVTLIARDANGCTGSLLLSDLITINDFNANLTSSHTDTICELPVSVNFSTTNITGSGTISYLWDFGNGSTANTASALAYYDTAGYYPVSLIVQDSFCRDTLYSPSSLSISSVDATFFMDTNVVCAPQVALITTPPNYAVNYDYWHFGDGAFSINAPSPIVHPYTQGGVFNVLHVVGNSYGCRDTATKTLTLSEPIANIGATPSSGCSPLDVQFTNLSIPILPQIPIVNWEWKLSPTATSTTLNPSMTYVTVGSYDVTLTVQDSLGCIDSITTQINVGEIPSITSWESTNDTVCAPDSISFMLQSNSTITSVTWHLDTLVLEGFTPEALKEPGTYTLDSVVLNNNGCKRTILIDSIFVINQTVADFDYTCGSLTVTFEADTSSSHVWLWEFGDPTTNTDIGLGYNPSYTYPNYGNYDVTLIAFNYITGCTDTLIKRITVTDEFNSFILSEDSICLGESLSVFDTNSLAEISIWYIIGDTTATISTFDFGEASLNPQRAGSHIIFLESSTPTGCTSQAYKSIFVSNPTPSIIMPDTTRGCVPLDKMLHVFTPTEISSPISNYQWNTGQTTDTIYHTITNSTFQNFIVTVTNELGCSRTDTFDFEPHWVTAAFSMPNHVCAPDSFQLNNLSSSSLPNSNYVWLFGDGDSSTLEDPMYSYNDGNFYNVKLYIKNDSLNCIDSITQFITADKIVAKWGADSTNATCPPMNTSFRDSTMLFSYSSTAISWKWYFGDGSASVINNPSHIYSLPGSYDVTMIATNGSGCTDTLTQDSFIFISGPIGTWSPIQSVGCTPLHVDFVAQSPNTVSYTWIFGDGGLQYNNINNTTDTISYTYLQSGEYYPLLILEDTLGCKVPFRGDTIFVKPYPTLEVTPDTSTHICLNETISFTSNVTNLSGNVDMDWYFGGGTPNYSNNPSPNIQFDSIGIFNVTIVVDMENCADTFVYNNHVKVHSPPLANFLATVIDSCVGFSSQFTDQSIPIEGVLESWEWNFNNGQQSNLASPTPVSFLTVDSFEVQLKVSNSFGCIDSTSQTVHARPFPIAAISSDTAICITDTLYLNGQGGLSYLWLGTASVNDSTIAETFSIPTVSSQYILQVLNEYNCLDYDTMNVTVHNLPDIDAGADQTICQGDSLLLVAMPSNYNSYEWIGNSTCPNCAQTLATPTLTQLYTVTVQDSNSCFNHDSITVTVLSTAFTKLNARTICKDDSIQLPSVNGTILSWAGPQLSCLQCPNPIATPGSSSLYTAQFKLANECLVEDSLLINVLDLGSFSAGEDQQVCKGETVILQAQLSTGIPFEWKSPAKLSDSASLTPILETTTSTYAELVVGEDACVTNDFVTIFVHSPSYTTTQDVDICEGDTTQLQVQSNSSQIEWLSTFGFLDTNAINQPNPMVKPSQSHQYGVVGQHPYCPNDTAYANITIHEKPLPNLGQDMQVLKSQPIQFNPNTNGNVITWQWTPADLLDCEDCPNPQYIATTDQTFTVQVVDSWGCIGSDSIHISIYPPCYVDLVTVPTAFSPNGDGINDQIHPYSIGNKIADIEQFSIYDRWGSLVFESNGLYEGWDGKYKGQKAAIGVYAYYLVYTCPLNGKSVVVVGEFTLIR